MSNKLARQDDIGTFAALVPREGPSMAELLEVNLGGAHLTRRDLTSIRIPAGGSVTWEIPQLGDVEAAKTVRGVVLMHTPVRNLFEGTFGEDSKVVCSSNDGIIGIGHPGGNCNVCPMAQWDDSLRKTPCPERGEVMVLRQEEMLPIILRLPQTSWTVFRNYCTELVKAGHAIDRVVTDFSLEKKVSNGMTYSKVVCSFVAPVPSDLQPSILTLVEVMAPVFRTAASSEVPF